MSSMTMCLPESTRRGAGKLPELFPEMCGTAESKPVCDDFKRIELINKKFFCLFDALNEVKLFYRNSFNLCKQSAQIVVDITQCFAEGNREFDPRFALLRRNR